MSSIKNAAIKIPHKHNTLILNKIYPKMPNQTYRIQISNTNPKSASHEQYKQNPIIQVGAKKVIQHQMQHIVKILIAKQKYVI